MVSWLVVGVGDIATKRVLPAILKEPHSRIAGIVTRDPAKAAPYAVPAWLDLAAALASCDAEVVYIATPVFLHAPQTIAALNSGRHVLCEKPMALRYADALSMQQAAQDSGRMLGVAYYRRMYPKVARTMELLRAGAIGQPVFAEATSHDWFDPTGSHRAWLGDPDLAGAGPLFDIGSHRIDLMNYLFGRPVHVSCHGSTLVHRIVVEDNATVVTEHETGVRSVVDVRWHSRTPRDEFRVRGTDGELDLTPLNGPTLVHPGGVEQIPAAENLHYPCIEDFVRAVQDGTSSRSTGASALHAEWVMNEARRDLGGGTPRGTDLPSLT